jgi:hypothetical protein
MVLISYTCNGQTEQHPPPSAEGGGEEHPHQAEYRK